MHGLPPALTARSNQRDTVTALMEGWRVKRHHTLASPWRICPAWLGLCSPLLSCAKANLPSGWAWLSCPGQSLREMSSLRTLLHLEFSYRALSRFRNACGMWCAYQSWVVLFRIPNQLSFGLRSASRWMHSTLAELAEMPAPDGITCWLDPTKMPC